MHLSLRHSDGHLLRTVVGALCLAALGTGASLLAQELPAGDVQNIVDQLKAKGIQIQGNVRVNIDGQMVILNGGGIQISGSKPAPTTPPLRQGPALSTLRWRNGESLSGEMVGVKDGTLSWWSPSFAESLSLDMEVLKDVEFATSAAAPQEPFVVNLRDGGRLFGTPAGIDNETLKIRSVRHGEVALQISEVLSIQRTRGPKLLYHGPYTAARWQPIATETRARPPNTATPPAWRTQEGGSFGTLTWNRGTRLELQLPQKVDVLLRLSSIASSPEFTFTLGTVNGPELSLEIWSGMLVLTRGNRFAPLTELSDKTSLSVRLLWDRKQDHAYAFTPEGQLLGELPAPSETTPRKPDAKSRTTALKGVQLLNNGADLTLEELRVREWSGTLPTAQRPGTAQMEFTNGRVVASSASKLSDTHVGLSSGEEIAIAELESLTPGVQAASSEPNPTATILAFNDGTRLIGSLQHMSDGKATVRIPASRDPIVASTVGLERLHLGGPPIPKSDPEKSLSKLDTLALGSVILHGQVEGNGGKQPRWLPTGGRSSVEVLAASQPVFTRPLQPGAVTPASALLYLKGGDVLPGEVLAMDTASLRFSSPLSEVREVPADQVQAVQFGGRKLELSGFNDAGWRQIRGTTGSLERGAARVLLKQASSLSHPNILQGDEVKFVLSAEEGWGALRARILTNGGDEPTGGISFLLYLSGSEVYAGQESERGSDFANQVQVRTGQNQPVNVRFALQDKFVEMFVNDVSICTVPVSLAAKEALNARKENPVINNFRGRNQPPPPKSTGAGMVIETVSIWGNGEQPVSVRDFRVRANPMRPWVPAVDPKAKEQVLTLPRFRTDNPPSHVLVALNGDVLRGRLEAATSTHLRMISGLEPLSVPRERVAAAIRLQPQDKAESPAPASKADLPPVESVRPTHWFQLSDGGRFGLQVESFGSAKVTGNSELLGHCEVPWDLIHLVRYTAPEPTSAQESYRDWKLKPAPEPVLPETGGQSSPLVGQEVKDFKLPLLTGGEFDFARKRGKILILDFWATWCGPCIQSLPELMDTVESLKGEEELAGKFEFLAVNESEPAAHVKRFLEQRNWDLPVALDILQSVGRLFQVEGIPHTVVVGPDGKIAWQNTGHRPGATQELAEMVRKLAKPTATVPAP